MAGSFSKARVGTIQRAMNAFTKKYLLDEAPLIVDGVLGPAARKRVRLIKFYLGYNAKRRRSGYPGHEFMVRMRHPKSPHYNKDLKTVRLGIRRRQKQRAHARAARKNWKNVRGFGTFDGKTVAQWMIPWLEKSRAAGWRGVVVSGVRTPAHSEHLCFAMCGAPTCPGRCAGRSSNHNMESWQRYPAGALDVSDYENFGAIQRKIGSPLQNALGARDPVHFSVSGR